MKSLLISLMAFLCALGVNATPSGSGTKEGSVCDCRW